jgi:hypothetical protein
VLSSVWRHPARRGTSRAGLGMAGMRRYRFRALVTFDPAAREGHASGSPGCSRALVVHGCCLLQPSYSYDYFPAVISPDEEELPRFLPGRHAVVTVALADGEAETFFAPGQRFAIWADAVVDDTVRAEGLVGRGFIQGPESRLLTCGNGGGMRGTTAGPARVRRLAAAGMPASGDRGRAAAGLSPGTGCHHAHSRPEAETRRLRRWLRLRVLTRKTARPAAVKAAVQARPRAR